MQQQSDYVLRTVEERGVRFVHLWFTDVLGSLKSFAITPAELETALEEGMTFDGSAIDGYTRVQESDMLAFPDPNTFEILPWRGEAAPVSRMFCDIRHLSEEPFEGDPRNVLKRNLERARDKGFTFYVAPEMEFFIFESHDEPKPLDHAGFFDLTQLDMVSELRRQTVVTLEAMGIPVEYSFHELGPSQHEIDLRYTDALTMADNVMTFRVAVKQVAADLGAYATFMPKPIEGSFGSGMHSHLSLFEGDVNAFHDAGDEYGLSKVGKCFIAGLLVHAREITAVTNQTVNSYKRLDRRLRSARPRLLGAQQRIGPGASAGAEEEQGELDTHRVPVARSRVQPVPRVLRDAGGGAQGCRRGLRPPERGHEQHLRDDRGGARRRRHRLTAPKPGRSRRGDGRLGACRRRTG